MRNHQYAGWAIDKRHTNTEMAWLKNQKNKMYKMLFFNNIYRWCCAMVFFNNLEPKLLRMSYYRLPVEMSQHFEFI